jgi:hypothetical protein
MICPGDNLTLSCCTNGSALRWIVNIISLTPLHFNRGESGIRTINLQSPAMEQPLLINQTVIQFSKISSSPLVSSVLTIENVTTNWNQTKIKCARSIEETSLTIIHIIDHSKSYLAILDARPLRTP